MVISRKSRASGFVARHSFTSDGLSDVFTRRTPSSGTVHVNCGSFVPFTTAWMGENHFAPSTVAVYGAVLCMAGVAYYILARALVHHHGDDSELAQALGSDAKGKMSIILYLVGIALSFANQWLALSLYVAVEVMWLIPDKRFEKNA